MIERPTERDDAIATGVERPLATAEQAEGVTTENRGSGSGHEEFLAASHSDSLTVPRTSLYSLPEEIEIADAARFSTWRDYLPDPMIVSPAPS